MLQKNYQQKFHPGGVKLSNFGNVSNVAFVTLFALLSQTYLEINIPIFSNLHIWSMLHKYQETSRESSCTLCRSWTIVLNKYLVGQQCFIVFHFTTTFTECIDEHKRHQKECNIMQTWKMLKKLHRLFSMMTNCQHFCHDVHGSIFLIFITVIILYYGWISMYRLFN